MDGARAVGPLHLLGEARGAQDANGDRDDDGVGGDAESPIGVHNQFSQKLNKEKGGLTARFSD